MNAPQDWDPRAATTLADPAATWDKLRQQCPVAYSDYLHYSVFRHDDVMRILMDHDTFSSQASRHVSVPNSMDPPEHSDWRRLIDPYLSQARVDAFAPLCRQLCTELVNALPRNARVELMTALAYPFALRMQCAFLGWPAHLHAPLLQWIDKKNAATLSGDTAALNAVASEFDDTIRALLKDRREAGVNASDDITTQLLHERMHGRDLTDAEIISILRNWTVGELGTLAASIGIIVWYLAAHPDLQQQLREQPELIAAANDEILRMYAPLASNRRISTCPVDIGARQIAAGARLTLMWGAANRDERVFDDAVAFRLDRDPALNLLYGAGIHACPGAALARLELMSITKALLASTLSIQASANSLPSRAIYPASGFCSLPLILRHDWY